MSCKNANVVIFLIGIVLLCGVTASPESESITAEQFFYDFFEAFNSLDQEAADAQFHYPWILVNDGLTSTLEFSPVNFTALDEDGWVYTEVAKVDRVIESDTTAIAYYELRRYNADGEAYHWSSGYFTAVKQDGAWVFSGILLGPEVYYDAVEETSPVDEEFAPDMGMSAEEYIYYFIDVFNSMEEEDINAEFNYPFYNVNNGNVLSIPQGPIVNYEAIIENEGWSYTGINDVEVIMESDSNALVLLDFSRYNDDDEPYFSAVAYFTLIKPEGKWLSASFSVPGSPNYSLGREPEEDLID